MTGFPAARGSQGPAPGPKPESAALALAWLQPWQLTRALLHLNEVEPGADGFLRLRLAVGATGFQKISPGKNGNTPVWSLFLLCYLAFAKIV